MPQTVIYVNYFSDPDPERRDEYLYCLSQNQRLDWVDKIYVFLESAQDQDDIKNHHKMEFIYHNSRMEFGDVFRHAADNLADSTTMIILNLDIYLDDSSAWRSIDRDFFQAGHAKKSMVLKRTDLLDLNGAETIYGKSWKRGKFCDGWMFKTPLDPEFLQENFDFCVGGAPCCDNVMMFLMSKHYHTYSWGAKYKTYHLDICRKSQASLMVLNSKTDYRAQERKQEHAAIPATQDWQWYLTTGQRPLVFLLESKSLPFEHEQWKDQDN